MLVLNLALLGFVFFNNQRPPHPGPEGRKPVPEMIFELLDFNETQKEEYRSLARAHHRNLRQIGREHGEKLYTYIESKGLEKISGGTEADLTEILDLEQARIQLTLDHIEDLKNICNDKQLEKFPAVLKAMFKGPRHLKGPPPGQGPPRK
ncbi:MAG: hypothetical protein AAF696_25835 [Bacteroidota bacterium]